MPTLTTTVYIDTEAEVRFDVYCGECGTGICGSCDANSKSMKLTVDLCPVCKKAYEDTIKSLEKEIEQLKDEIKHNK